MQSRKIACGGTRLWPCTETAEIIPYFNNLYSAWQRKTRISRAGGERKTVPFRISSLNRRLAGLKKPVISISPNLQTSAPKKRKHKKGRGSPPRPSHRTKPALAAAPKRAVCFAHAGNITPAGPAQRPGLGRDAPQFRRGHLRRPRTHCPSGWPAQSSQSSPEGR